MVLAVQLPSLTSVLSTCSTVLRPTRVMLTASCRSCLITSKATDGASDTRPVLPMGQGEPSYAFEAFTLCRRSAGGDPGGQCPSGYRAQYHAGHLRCG